MNIFWARLVSFGHLGLISDPLIVSKSHNETHDPWITLRPTVGQLDFVHADQPNYGCSELNGAVTLKTNLTD